MKPLPLPPGAHSVNSYLVVDDPDALLAFLTHVFDARVLERLVFDGKVAHAEALIGDARVMIGGARGGPPATAMLYVYVDDCDAAYARAIGAGAESLMAPADMYYGDRHGGVRDAAGNSWWIATHIEEIEPAELQRRHEADQRRRAAAG